jgi:glycosyltransferase involved in cell wall biosynthesis
MALAGAINQLASDDELCRQLGEQAQEHALQNFSIDQMIRLHTHLYRQVINFK